MPWPLHIDGLVPPAGFSLRVPILMYHRIVPQALAGDSLPGLVVSPTLFAEQLAVLRAAGWRTVTVAQVAAALQHGESLPPRTFAISIDDGWADGYTYALPILQRLGDVATFYVISDRLHDPRFLSPTELGVLAADGMEIGDHTASHLEVTDLTAQTLHAQVMTDALAIAAILGERPATFAYPSGRFDAAAISELSRDGFALAVTTAPGRTEDWADRFAAPRVRVGPSTSPAELLLRLDLGVSWG